MPPCAGGRGGGFAYAVEWRGQMCIIPPWTCEKNNDRIAVEFVEEKELLT